MARLASTVKRFLPPAVVMAAIFAVSHQAGDDLSLPALPGIDKIAHMAVYGLLAATLIRAFSRRMRQSWPGRVVTMTAIWCLLYGVSDEFHQSFIPGRCASGLDVLADTAGALLVGVAWLFHHRLRIQADIQNEYPS